ncbi:mRNA degradation ribonuclease J1/J2 [Deinococcus sp. UYEF24]
MTTFTSRHSITDALNICVHGSTTSIVLPTPGPLSRQS